MLEMGAELPITATADQLLIKRWLMLIVHLGPASSRNYRSNLPLCLFNSTQWDFSKLRLTHNANILAASGLMHLQRNTDVDRIRRSQYVQL
jgi:hypothetical protein